jgi:hypothetical protein
MSAILVRVRSSEKNPGIDPLGFCLFLLQCSIYGSLGWFKVGIFRQGQSASAVQEHLLRRVSLQCLVLWTLLLAVSPAQRLSLQPTFVFIGMIRAFHYFLLFALVCESGEEQMADLADGK